MDFDTIRDFFFFIVCIFVIIIMSWIRGSKVYGILCECVCRGLPVLRLSHGPRAGLCLIEETL
jgi:hypothetical protein